MGLKMIRTIRYKQQIPDAFCWTGDIEEAKRYFKDSFWNVKGNVLLIKVKTDDLDDVIIGVNIGDWYIPSENKYVNGCICTSAQFQEEFEIVNETTDNETYIRKSITRMNDQLDALGEKMCRIVELAKQITTSYHK